MGVPAWGRMAMLGALQGFALWVLHEQWPTEPVVVAAFVSACFFIVVSGLVLHMARTGADAKRLALLAIGTGAVFAAVAFWVGWQLPQEDVTWSGDGSRVGTWIAASGFALYVAGPFLQIFQTSGRARFPYPDLYRHSWNNFFIASLGLLLVAALWTVLLLWAALFNLLGIDLFEEIFEEASFVYTVTGAAAGYGLAVGRESESVIATLRGLTQSLFRGLAPLLSAVTLAFLATVPFTGLKPLFEATSAGGVLIGWLGIFLLFLNAVYVDGSGPPPYRLVARRLVEAGALVMPVLAGIALYAIGLRLGQYGLTPDRVWATVLASVLGLYAAGYAAAVLMRGEPWLPRVQGVNVALAWVVIALAFLLHTPLGDPLGWSLRSQLARLHAGRVAPDAFDYAFLRFSLGRAGYQALQNLERESQPESSASRRARFALETDSYWRWKEVNGERASMRFERVPPDDPWPVGLRETLRELGASRPHDARKLQRCGLDASCVVFAADLDQDGTPEEVVAIGDEYNLAMLVLTADRSGWRKLGWLIGVDTDADVGTVQHMERLRAGEARLVAPRHRDLEIDGVRYRLVGSD